MTITLFSRRFKSEYGGNYSAEVVQERGLLVAQLVFEPSGACPYQSFYALGEGLKARRNVLAAARRRGLAEVAS